MKYGDYNDESKKYAKEIAIECIRRKISIGDLEKSVNLSPGYISRCRNGKVYMSINAIEVISNFLGVDFIRRIHCKEDENEQQIEKEIT